MDREYIPIRVLTDEEAAAYRQAQKTIYQERKERIAARLDELIDPWEKEEDHLEVVLATLEADPLAIIEDLLTRIEDLEA